jgi:hypothetical protein
MAQKIKVHEKALAHLTRGMYRSPASALRELVSNAWDADATRVRITTGAPVFFQLVVRDNGRGFTKEDFEELMKGGIGNSQKRPSQLQLAHGRKVIGRLGVGMLGIAQICLGFTVTSKTQSGAAFKARIRLYDLIKEKLDSQGSPLVKGTGGQTVVDVGEYDVLPFDGKDFEVGTQILADDLHPVFVKAFQESVGSKHYKDVPIDWAKAITIMSHQRSLQELGDYWRLLWELSISCPVPYVSSTALPNRIIANEQKRLTGYEFTVLIDGINILKPVRLSGNKSGYTIKAIPTTTLRSYGKNVIFHGYIAVQEGVQLRPDELRGILIRIKDVGIGYYDPSMLDFRDNEGPRSRWITGEVFIEEGLEDALNIDRDSFNKFNPEFRVLQEYIHGFLRKEIFPDVYRNLELRSMEKAEERNQARKKDLETVLSGALSTSVKVVSSKDSDHVSLEKGPKVTRLVLPSDAEIGTKKSQKPLAGAMLAILEVALREKTKAQQRERFTELLMELLDRW